MWRKVRFSRYFVLLVILITCCCPGNSLLAGTPFSLPFINATETDFLSISDEMKMFLEEHVPITTAATSKKSHTSILENLTINVFTFRLSYSIALVSNYRTKI